MDNIAVKRRIDVALTNANIVTYAAVSLFLPYILTAIILIFLAVYILANKHTRQLVFIHSGSRLMKFFFIYVLAVPLMYRNWLGLAAGAALIFGLVLGLFMRSVMTRKLYEEILTLICTLSLTSAGYAIFEALVNYIEDNKFSHRISAVFFYPNYFGTVVGMVVIICAYKILTEKENKWFYYITIVMNIVSMYLCKSMFVWVEVFIGIAVLFAVFKKYRLLSFWICGAILGAFLIFDMNLDLIPRLNDVEVTVRLRQQIWKQAIHEIQISPFFGHGLISYGFLFKDTYNNLLIPHAHNIYIDLLLNFGILGTILFSSYFIRYYWKVIKVSLKEEKTGISALILAVSAAAMVHGTTDITLMWVQTLPLFLLILSGVGSEEKAEQYAEGLEVF